MLKKICILLGILCLISCSKKGASIEGQLKDSFTNKPISYPDVTFETKTNIKEELNQAKKISTPDKNGTIKLSGLLPEKNYHIYSENKSIRIFNQTIKTPKIDETYIIPYPVYVVDTTPNTLDYLYDHETAYIFEFTSDQNKFRIYEQIISVFNRNNVILYKYYDDYLLIVRIDVNEGISDYFSTFSNSGLTDFKMRSSQPVISSVINTPFSRMNLLKFRYSKDSQSRIYQKATEYLLKNGIDKVNLSFVKGSSLFLISTTDAEGNIQDKLIRENARVEEERYYRLIVTEE